MPHLASAAMVGLRTVAAAAPSRLEWADDGRRWAEASLWGRPAACTDDRVLVVAQAHKTVDFIRNWTRLLWTNCSVVISAGLALNRTRNEWPAWAPWIADHYDDLPEHVVLLSDSGPHWHTPSHYARAAAAHRPCCRYPLGTQGHDQNDPEAECARQRATSELHGAACRSAERERAPLEQIDRAFGLRRRAAPTGAHLLDTACCNEQILSRAAIRMHPRAAYAELAARIGAQPTLRWGPSMERANSAIFSAACEAAVRAGLRPARGACEAHGGNRSRWFRGARQPDSEGRR